MDDLTSVVGEIRESVGDWVEAQLQNAIKAYGLTAEEVQELARQGRTKGVRDPWNDTLTYYIDDVAILTLVIKPEFIPPV